MKTLYCTADKVGTPSGGGIVTWHEYLALSEFGGETSFKIDREDLGPAEDPFAVDETAEKIVSQKVSDPVSLVHIYAGCFTKTVRRLKERGARVTYTAAAHDKEESIREWKNIVGSYPFPHMTDPALWRQYLAGYLEADLLVCPSNLSKRVMESYGAKVVRVVPHGTEIPHQVRPFPKRFTVGYLGQIGPDKGVIYLLQAWKRLNYPDAALVLAGRDSRHLVPMIREHGGGNVEVRGFVNDVSDFYGSITIYVQPSVCEGFGIEILEAMSHGRPVIASAGAGAADLVDAGVGRVAPSRSPESIAEYIDWFRHRGERVESMGAAAREKARQFTWERIRSKYRETWNELLPTVQSR